MDVRSGSPFSLVRNERVSPYAPLQSHIQCDVAVVGAGISGALAAHHLVEAGVNTVLLDKRDIGRGSTAASTGLLQYELDVPLHELVLRLGERSAVQIYQLCRRANANLGALLHRLGENCGFRRRQSLYLASEKSDRSVLKREFAVRERYGFPVEFLDSKELNKRFSLTRPAALLTADAGQIDAYLTVHALVQNACRKGLKVFTGTRIEKHKMEGDRTVLFTGDGFRVKARKIVIATGYEGESFLKTSRVKLTSTYAIATAPLPFIHPALECLVWEAARPYLYVRPNADGGALIGGEDEPFASPAKRDRMLPKKTRKLAAQFQKLFGREDFEIAFAWSGTFAETSDSLPWIGECPGFPGAYFALGYGANGITFSQIAAEIVRDLVLGRANEDAHLFSFGRSA